MLVRAPNVRTPQRLSLGEQGISNLLLLLFGAATDAENGLSKLMGRAGFEPAT
jgi:hypothetical protein